MKVLLLGSGGREHALALKISQSAHHPELFIAPGNAGTGLCGTNVEMDPTNFWEVKKFCLEKRVDMVVVGPEEPLVRGIYDFMTDDPGLSHIAVIGPSRMAAQLEGSKAFAKEFMLRNGIPTAGYREFSLANYEEGLSYIRSLPTPIVLKADGLAAGKGVIIAQSHVEAMAEYEMMLQRSKFGEASRKIVIEEFLTGTELSVFVLTDGKDYLLLPEAKDYKRVGEGDKGLNTGGMGAVSPVPFADATFMEKVRTRVIEPTISGIRDEGLVYKGFVFFGLIKVNDDPFVIEYNCRMGDPETEVVIPRLKNDIIDLFLAVDAGRLSGIVMETDPRAATTVMAVSQGYPGHYDKGLQIDGLEEMNEEGVHVFHAGTMIQNGKVLTNGGRVLAVTSFGSSIAQAVSTSVKVLGKIYYPGITYRKDIGYEFS